MDYREIKISELEEKIRRLQKDLAFWQSCEDSQVFLRTPVEEVVFSQENRMDARIHTAMKRKVATIGDLVALIEDNAPFIRGIGEKGWIEIHKTLAKNGINFIDN